MRKQITTMAIVVALGTLLVGRCGNSRTFEHLQQGRWASEDDPIAKQMIQKERDCRLDDAKVRFFGDSLAIIYGSERALRTDKDGKEAMRCLVWTDTWLKREGKWEIIAAQDTAVPCK